MRPKLVSSAQQPELEEEVDAAVALVQLRLLKACSMNEVRAFSCTLRECLLERVQGHCYNEPRVGSAFRCIRSHRGKHDNVLVAAACLSNTRQILAKIPKTFCLWIDPGCVALRLNNSDAVEERHISNTRFAIVSSDDEASNDDVELQDDMLIETRVATTDDVLYSTTSHSTLSPSTTALSSTTSSPVFSANSSSFSPTVSQDSLVNLIPAPKPPIDTEAATKAARAAAQAALAEAQRMKQQMAKAARRQSPKPARGRRSRRRRQGEGPWVAPGAGFPIGNMPWAGAMTPEQLMAMNAINNFMQQAC